MDGGNLTPISRPTTVSVKVDPTLKECESDGFGFPTFRQLRKLDRVVLCAENLDVGSPFAYRLLAIANTRGWFAAATNTGIILSPLNELQKSLESDDTQPVFKPQKTIALSAQPVTLAFACNETRFLVGLAQGEVLLYDVDKLCSPGSDDSPLHALRTSNSPARQIVPNPSSDPTLAEYIAIVRFDGNIEVVNSQFQSQGGWTAREHEALPVAASWSPKGKQLAIGLRLGDILTYTLSDKAMPQKHIPPTAQRSTLVSLDWLSGGFTFRTSYAPSNPEADVSTQHVVHLDTRQSTVTTTDLTHPFRLSERLNQVAHVVVLPKWDDENATAESTKGLMVVGDMSSTDFEVFGHISNTWYCYYQENPLSIPLNKEQEDTVLLSLAVDLVNGTENPIMYAYLNDGTIQGWYMEHSKPYAGMVGGTAAVPQPTSQPVPPEPSSGFGAQTPQQPAFGQSSFGQAASSPSSAFGQASSAFAQPSSTSSAFGQPSFGQSSAFGTSSAFGSTSTSAFGQASSSGFGAPSPGAFGTGTGFGSLTTTVTNPPSQEISMADAAPSFGGLSLGGSDDSKPKSTGGLFGSPAPLPLPPDHSVNKPSPQLSTTSSDSSGSTIRPATGFGAFGGGAFGENSPYARASSTPSTSAFATALGNKPAEPPKSAFGQTGFATPAGSNAPKSAFGQPAFGQPAFGQPAFGQPAFGQSGFQKPMVPAASAASTKTSGGFGAFASGPSTFGAASGTPTTNTSSTKVTGGFGGFASGGPSAFGNTSSLRSAATEPPKSVSEATEVPKTSVFGGGGSPAGSTGPSVAGSSNNAPSNASPFGTPSKPSPFGGSPFASGSSPFGPQRASISPETKSPAPIASPPASPPLASSSTPSPFASPSQPAPTTGAFANLKSSSFQPAAGFGAFGASNQDTSSPFFKAAANQTPPVSAFSNLQTTPTKPPAVSSSPSFGSPSALGAQKSAFAPLSGTSSPTFGSPSALGVKQSAFPPLSSSPSVSPTPAKPSIGGFGAYTKSASPFGKIPAPQSSFSDMLKAKDTESEESDKTSPPPSTPVKAEPSSPKPSPPVPAPLPSTAEPEKEKESDAPEMPTPAASTPAVSPSSAETPPKDKGKGPVKETDKTQVESSSTSPESKELSKEASLSSVASSYVDVSQEDTVDGDVSDDAYRDGAEDDDDDTGSFLSESISSTAGEDDEDYVPSDEEAEEERSPTPSQVPLPPSRSQSSTPQPESGTPPPVLPSSTETILPPIKEESTTPPGSPEKQPVVVPPPTPAAAALGLRRPNTRPVRSSPLANAVVGGDEEQEETKETLKAVAPKPRPASPRPPFGTLPLKPSVEETVTPSKEMRPKTPPLLSTMGGGGGSLFGNKAAPVPKPSSSASTAVSPSPFLSPFAPPPGATTKPSMPPPSLPGGSPFSKLPPPGPASTPPTTPFTPPPGNLFGRPLAQPAQPTEPITPTPSSKPAFSLQDFQEGMQKECAVLWVTMSNELECLQKLAQKASQQSEVINTKTGGSRLKADLGNSSHWYPADALKYRETLLGYAEDLELLKEGREEAKKILKELGSGVVKANTRKEEIERFNRAKQDDSFAKMLRSRTLGPEHLETRVRLRGELMRRKTEVSKLENVLKDYKKKVSSMKSYKGVFRAPSLDTVNRTYRNIDIAIQQERDAIDRLEQRLSRIDLNSTRSSAPKRDPRLPDLPSRPRAVLPHAAVTTAAALNAERSAQKLKQALLGLRKEPLLNQPKANAPTPPVAFLSTSQASGSTKEGVVFNTPIKIEGPLFGNNGVADTSSFGTDFEFPDDDDSFHLSTPVPTGRRGAGGGKKHGGGLFKKSPSTATTSPKAPTFDWGPLPAFDYGKAGSGSPLVMGISGGPRK
ncbi:uncharacterized protein EV420DRAFT_77584 [Desarmillaria tabescens]|uniref:Nucleoporin Nup159/Nup146 N-terminal domain-containing protein n=1 Tax=Armillaria tabescens TaxID=1929756 RepID=A0AA39NQD1_ARMTA|nr:uncharacterized protein EV420DRAFT_77584 [Desarmillaria tabescens]KAK0469922.1 hypothetical protein EV420DRAFT_77584 [Desarmillaria tabescens]